MTETITGNGKLFWKGYNRQMIVEKVSFYESLREKLWIGLANTKHLKYKRLHPHKKGDVIGAF